MNANKVIPESWFLCVNFDKFASHLVIEVPITVQRLKGCDWSLDTFIEVNFSKFTTPTKFSGTTLFAFISTSVILQLILLSVKVFAP